MKINVYAEDIGYHHKIQQAKGQDGNVYIGVTFVLRGTRQTTQGANGREPGHSVTLWGLESNKYKEAATALDLAALFERIAAELKARHRKTS